MGNLDSLTLFSDEAILRREVERILRQADNRNGHIFNLGHGILPGTPVPSAIPQGPDHIDHAEEEPIRERSALFFVVFVLLGLALGMGLFSLYLALSN